MKHLLLALSLFTLTATAGVPKHHLIKNHVAPKAQTYVYICQGRYSKRYHSSPNCKGLDNCKGGVIKVTLEEAQKEGRTPCHICE